MPYFVDKDGKWQCPQCGYVWLHTRHSEYPTTAPFCTCESPTDQMLSVKYVPNGPGDFLHEVIRDLTGQIPVLSCDCTQHIRQMNSWGPAGCREHIDEIVGWLVKEAKRHDWYKYAVAVPGSRLFIRQMVISSIVKSEKVNEQAVTVTPAT